jgi:heptose-I-phosphate ethanolaminephosphotransferase
MARVGLLIPSRISSKMILKKITVALNIVFTILVLISTLTLLKSLPSNIEKQQIISSDNFTFKGNESYKGTLNLNNGDAITKLNLNTNSFTLFHLSLEIFNNSDNYNEKVTVNIFDQDTLILNKEVQINDGFKVLKPLVTQGKELTIKIIRPDNIQGSFKAKFESKYMPLRDIISYILIAILLTIIGSISIKKSPVFILTWCIPVILLNIYIGKNNGEMFSEYTSTLLVLVIGKMLSIHSNSVIRLSGQIISTIVTSLIFYSVYNLWTYGGWNGTELVATFQTNISEAIEFALQEINILTPLILLSPLALFITIKRYHHSNLYDYKAFSLLVFLAAINLSYGLNYNNIIVIKEFNDSYQEYTLKLSAWKDMKEERLINLTSLDIEQNITDDTYIIIIGESLNRNHMSLYGYSRNTNPLLGKRSNLITFKDAISSHSQTTFSLGHALTNNNIEKPLEFKDATSIINLANAAGFTTYRISNQNKVGFSDNIVSIIGDDADHTFFSSTATRPSLKYSSSIQDEFILPKIKEAITTKATQPKIIFVHLIGNHFDYKKRYLDLKNEYTLNEETI